jgi:glyoxylase-like metal-dependent hydrolase (beta-lactamase superfamily II)
MDKRSNGELHDAMEHQFLPMFSIAGGVGTEVLPDLYSYTNQIVNICLVGTSPDDFVMVDTGMPESAKHLIHAVEERFDEGAKPKAIILTHGHFDHVGAVVDLVERWDVDVYAHQAEFPFLTGKESYPDPDGTVEGGLVAKMSPMFPTDPVNLGNKIKPLPEDGTIPHMSGWKWIHTPGHSPGHVSFFRESDRALIAGDAFVTVKQESLYRVMTQDLEINGPPRYLTTDWQAAKSSVEKLAALRPEVAITGHGLPITGPDLREGLMRLANEFDEVAVPSYGKYVDDQLH